jgi:hypothetical protein
MKQLVRRIGFASLPILLAACGGNSGENIVSDPVAVTTDAILVSSDGSAISSDVVNVATDTSGSETTSGNGTTTTSTDGLLPTELDCENLDPDRVYIYGTYLEGFSLGALAVPSEPTTSCVGFDNSFAGANANIPSYGSVSRDGRYVYKNYYFDTAAAQILEMTQDDVTISPLDISNQGFDLLYPAEPTLNDTVLADAPTTVCSSNLDRVLLTPQSTDIVFSCGTAWYRENGQAVRGLVEGEEIFGLYNNGTILTSINNLTDARLINLAGGEAPLTLVADNGEGGSGTVGSRIVSTKHVPNSSALWVLVRFGGQYERWILEDQTLTFQGRFAALTDSFAVNPLPGGEGVLDGEGVLWQVRESDADDAVVVVRPLEPGVSTTVYSEAQAVAREIGSVGSLEDLLFVLYDGASALVTGP